MLRFCSIIILFVFVWVCSLGPYEHPSDWRQVWHVNRKVQNTHTYPARYAYKSMLLPVHHTVFTFRLDWISVSAFFFLCPQACPWITMATTLCVWGTSCDGSGNRRRSWGWSCILDTLLLRSGVTGTRVCFISFISFLCLFCILYYFYIRVIVCVSVCLMAGTVSWGWKCKGNCNKWCRHRKRRFSKGEFVREVCGYLHGHEFQVFKSPCLCFASGLLCDVRCDRCLP